MHVLDLSGNRLFTGTRHDCKQFVRKNKVNRFKFVERFVEKAVLTFPVLEEEIFEEEFKEDDERL